MVTQGENQVKYKDSCHKHWLRCLLKAQKNAHLKKVIDVCPRYDKQVMQLNLLSAWASSVGKHRPAVNRF